MKKNANKNKCKITYRFVVDQNIESNNIPDFIKQIEAIETSLQPNQKIMVAQKIIGKVIVFEIT